MLEPEEHVKILAVADIAGAQHQAEFNHFDVGSGNFNYGACFPFAFRYLTEGPRPKQYRWIQNVEWLPGVGGVSGLRRFCGRSQKELPVRFSASSLPIARATNLLNWAMINVKRSSRLMSKLGHRALIRFFALKELQPQQNGSLYQINFYYDRLRNKISGILTPGTNIDSSWKYL
jgi:hypothetical protein